MVSKTSDLEVYIKPPKEINIPIKIKHKYRKCANLIAFKYFTTSSKIIDEKSFSKD